MFFKKDNNFVRDDELLDDDEEESIFKKLFKKKKKDNSEKKESFFGFNKENTNNSNDGVDFDNKYKEINKKDINLDIQLIKKIVTVIVILIILFTAIPIIVTKYNNKRDRYVTIVTDIANRVNKYYNMDGQACTTKIRGKYYYYFYDTKYKLGDDYVSPMNGKTLRGYVEIDIDSHGRQSYYVSFTDGIFGLGRTNISNISKKNIGVFPKFAVEKHPNMDCKQEFVFSS